MFFILAMVIGTFEGGFQKQRVEARKVRRVFERAGVLAAFVLLDFDENEVLSRQEFKHFIRFIRPLISDEDAENIFTNIKSSVCLFSIHCNVYQICESLKLCQPVHFDNVGPSRRSIIGSAITGP